MYPGPFCSLDLDVDYDDTACAYLNKGPAL